MENAVNNPLQVENWGLTVYAEACKRQLECVEAVVQGRTRGFLVFTEHLPVYTSGARGPKPEEIAPSLGQVPLVATSRGGGITYHGPGQIVFYPIVGLNPRRDLGQYLRLLERVVLQVLHTLGFTQACAALQGNTGVWLGNAKVCAIGVAVRRWVAYHGLALNCTTHLEPFYRIAPCGLSGELGQVTSLNEWMPEPPGAAMVQELLADAFQKSFQNYLLGG